MDYEIVTEDLQNKSPEFLELYAKANPLPGARAKVPLLEVMDVKQSAEPIYLTESLVVAEYIAEQYGQTSNENDDSMDASEEQTPKKVKPGASLCPPSARDRATVRLFTELCGGPAFSYFPLLRAKGDAVDDAVKTFKEGLIGADTFLKHHDSSPFLLGNRFSLAECNAAPFVQRACTILPAFTGPDSANPDMPKVDPLAMCEELGLERLQTWIEAVMARPSVVTTGVPKDKLIESTNKMLERFATMEKK